MKKVMNLLMITEVQEWMIKTTEMAWTLCMMMKMMMMTILMITTTSWTTASATRLTHKFSNYKIESSSLGIGASQVWVTICTREHMNISKRAVLKELGQRRKEKDSSRYLEKTGLVFGLFLTKSCSMRE